MNNKTLLSSVHSPKDIKNFNFDKLKILSFEIRKHLIRVISQNGGHLASNLGVVELTIALHKVFDTPEDQIVWDVGHQCYTHKLLTGRAERFSTVRCTDGLSGFPKTAESSHDAFIAGHASTSIAAACGLARAKTLSKDTSSVVAVIGDGAFTGGLAYEAMNNAGRSGDNLIVVLNDNEMSISSNVGALASHLAKIRSTKRYFNVKDTIKQSVEKIPFVGNHMKQAISVSKTAFKEMLYKSNLFESLGFDYMGPVDGHDLSMLCDVLARAKALHRPVLVHVHTVKGKGYSFAEKNPGAYHGVSKFDIETGNPDVAAHDSFSSVFGQELVKLAREDENICAITAAMSDGTGLRAFEEEFSPKKRFFDVGIAEEYAVTFGSGLAANGKLPVFAIYSTFLQRSYDQLIHDASIEKRHLVLAVDRAGIVGDDGETHQGLFDVSFLSAIPGMVLYAPATYDELRICLKKALYECDGLCGVRYPRGAQPNFPEKYLPISGTYHHISSGAKTVLVTYGRLYEQVCRAAELLKEQQISVDILKLTQLCPIPKETVELLLGYENILFAEEAMQHGGAAEQMLIRLVQGGFRGKYIIKAIDGVFVQQADLQTAFARHGLDAQSLMRAVRDEFEKTE